MGATRELGHPRAGGAYRLRDRLPGRLGTRNRSGRLIGNQLPGLDFPLQMVDFLLTGQQAGLLGIGRIKTHTVRINQMPLAHHKHCASGKFVATGQGLGQVIDPKNP